MKKTLLILCIGLATNLLFSRAWAEDISLEQVWQLDGLSNPESVVYDAKSDSLYVSNINGNPFEKDNNGFIAKVSLQGEVKALHWATGLNAPKGLAIYGDHLYVADIDELVEIDLASGEIGMRYPDAEAKFLNDVAAADDGSVYVSDPVTNTIHQLRDGKFTKWLSSSALRGPNGLLIESDRMLVAGWGTGEGTEAMVGQVLAVSMQGKSISIVGNKQTEGNLDGIESNTMGDYFITEWTLGKLILLKRSGAATTLISLEKGTADLDYVQTRKMLYLPMLKTNKLIAYKVR
jgi:sugar lactone lactonase YvrE